MARPVFVPDSDKPFMFRKYLWIFEYFPGSSIQRSSVRLRVCMRRMWLGFADRAFWRCRPERKGHWSSVRAFNLMISIQDVEVVVLNVLSRLQGYFCMGDRLLICLVCLESCGRNQIGD